LTFLIIGAIIALLLNFIKVWKIILAQKNKSIEDVLTVLLEIAGSMESWGSRELARALNLDPTRTNRFLRTLTDAGFLVQDEYRKYYSGPGMQVLAAQSIHGSRLLRCALPVIEQMWPVDHIVALGTRHLDRVCYLYHAESGMSFAEGIGRCNINPATSSSIGLVMLSELSNEEVIELYAAHEIAGYFNSVDELLEKLQEIRSLGYCAVESYPDPQYYSMAAIVGTPTIGALAFSRITEAEKDKKIALLLKKAAEINYALENKIMEQGRYVLQG
jgi:DNA-binding IclR family transcriptional regulator